jgi:hypothetical protein
VLSVCRRQLSTSLKCISFEMQPGDRAAKCVTRSRIVGTELKVPRNVHAVMQYAHDQDLVTGLLVEDDVRTVFVAAES